MKNVLSLLFLTCIITIGTAQDAPTEVSAQLGGNSELVANAPAFDITGCATCPEAAARPGTGAVSVPAAGAATSGSLSLYPTPVAGRITFTDLRGTYFSASIMDSSGRRVKNWAGPLRKGLLTASVAGLEPGAYVAAVRTTGGMRVTRFVVR